MGLALGNIDSSSWEPLSILVDSMKKAVVGSAEGAPASPLAAAPHDAPSAGVGGKAYEVLQLVPLGPWKRATPVEHRGLLHALEADLHEIVRVHDSSSSTLPKSSARVSLSLRRISSYVAFSMRTSFLSW